MEQIIAAVIGGILAAGTGWFFEGRREAAKLKQLAKFLTTGICDDLQRSINLYDKISEEWEKTKTVWLTTLNELRESRQTYQNNKEWVTVFENAELRNHIFRYYLQSADRINTLEYQQRRKDEISNRYDDLVRQIKFQDPSMSHGQALNTATSYMEKEKQEYIGLDTSIPDSVQKLDQFKTTADKLLATLKKEL
ncbi:MAG: hypothetical protein KAU35_02685 [candidate division Zixibacteria bacterium]|nr:hypothetical protein [candidate division Zixibacteria bacterium]